MIVNVGAAFDDAGLGEPDSAALAGLAPVFVHSVRDALALAPRLSPHAIVIALRAEANDECQSVRALSACTGAVVAVTEPADARRIARLLEAGACGYLFFSDVRTRLAWAIQGATSGCVSISRAVAQVVLRGHRAEAAPQLAAGHAHEGAPECALSPRQREVLRLLALGHSYVHIALALDLSVHTVRTHLRTTYERLGASTKVEAVMIAMSLGLLNDAGK